MKLPTKSPAGNDPGGALPNNGRGYSALALLAARLTAGLAAAFVLVLIAVLAALLAAAGRTALPWLLLTGLSTLTVLSTLALLAALILLVHFILLRFEQITNAAIPANVPLLPGGCASGSGLHT
jgi:hypothetical protein